MLTRVLIVATLITVWASYGAMAARLSALEQQGKAVLTRLCAACHAVGEADRSRHLGAPAFRSIQDRYDIDDLVERLREGFTAPHPDMPTFTFTPEHARAVRAYLKAIQR